MGDVYRNSSLNISALVSPKSTSGILRPQLTAHAVQPRTTTMRVKPGGDVSVTVEYRDEEYETLYKIYENCPLSSRGWCLQESILSPRQLYYGMQQLYWSCPSGFRAADGLASSSDVKFRSLPEISRYLQQDVIEQLEVTKPNWHLVLRQYYQLVEMYCKRSLTLEDDMLPAFSGISSHLSPHFGDYLAGLWEKDFRTGLLWSGLTMRGRDAFRRSATYRAPSWSWAAGQGRVEFPMRMPDVPASRSVQLVDKHIVLRDETNPYREVSYASLTLRGLTTPVVRSRPELVGLTENDNCGWSRNIFTSDNGNSPIRSKCLDPIDNNPSPPIVRRDETSPGSGPTDGTAAYLALLVWVVDNDDANGPFDQAIHGLILKPTRSLVAGEYQRFGTFRFKRLHDLQLDTWEANTVKLI